jgi:hypothetical protein
MDDQTDSLSARLEAAQERARRFRCEAFVEYSPIVAGEKLRPITLETYNALVAFGNAFVMGTEIGFADIANFIWIHHPRFGQFNRKEKARVTRRVFDSLRPTFPNLNAAARVLSQFPRFRILGRLTTRSESERVTEAADEIRRLIIEATQDLPTGDEKGEPIPFAFQAYMLNLFRRELGMSFDETRAIPLRQLAQHFREVLHNSSKGKALLLTASEAEIWREHLARREAESKTQK